MKGITELARDNYNGFLYKLYTEGHDLPQEIIIQLIEAKYITDHELVPKDFKKKVIKGKRSHSRDFEKKSEQEKMADEEILIVEEGVGVGKSDIIKVDEQQEVFDGSIEEIKVSDWKPKKVDLLNPSKAFVEWIDSINRGFLNKKEYKPYNLYRQQARQWLSDRDSFSDYTSLEKKIEYASKDRYRCANNSMYALNNYTYIKDGESEDGKMPYKTAEAQEVACFLIDCGYSMIIGKPRQIWFSTTIGAAAMNKACHKPSFFVKYIAENKDKGEEIFEDKIKYPFYHYPKWKKPTMNNDQEGLIRFLSKKGKKKGDVSGSDSKIMVEAPYKTAINGGSPNMILIDEIGQIPILSAMINEGRPTLMGYNPKTGMQETKRQLVAFGTGGEVDKGGRGFEVEFKAALKAWKEREFHYGIIPIFFDCFARPGLTKEEYERQKKIYYAKGEESKVQFHMHYPTAIDDMFLLTSDLIVPVEVLNRHLDRIYVKSSEQKFKKGYFEPIYDTNRPENEHSDTPYAIVGSTFIPLSDEDPLSIATIIHDPVAGWDWRYFQGTDPINTQSGHSKFASAMWDDHEGNVPAYINFRVQDYRYCYLQSILMGLYYSPQVLDLAEYNAGGEYINYKEQKGFFKTLIPESLLPKVLQTSGAARMGLNKRVSNTKFIINRIYEMIDTYGDNIDVEDLYIQLKSYIKSVHMTQTGKLTEQFKLVSKHQFDDVIDAVVYAYIAAQCYPHKEAKSIIEKTKSKVTYKYVRGKDMRLRRERVVTREKVDEEISVRPSR